MRLIGISLGAALAAAAALHAQETTRSPHELAVLMVFEHPSSDVCLDAMEREIESVMHDTGVSLLWRTLGPSTSQEDFGDLVVARFRGRCQALSGDPRGLRPRTLGRTHVSDGEILMFPEVDCDHVRALIQPELESESAERGDRVLGRAMGRVLAHELYHILARTLSHARTGLAKVALSPADLVAASLAFERKQSESIRRAISASARPIPTLGDGAGLEPPPAQPAR